MKTSEQIIDEIKDLIASSKDNLKDETNWNKNHLATAYIAEIDILTILLEWINEEQNEKEEDYEAEKCSQRGLCR